MDLSTKVGVVTGAARGIGHATALTLADMGIKAIAVVDQLDEVFSFADEANECFERKVMVPFKGSVTSSDFRRHVFTEMQSLHGPVSICIPAAGITRDRLAVKIDKTDGTADVYSEADWDIMMDVNLKAPIYWALQTIASVAEDRFSRRLGEWHPEEHVQGCIIFIGSVSSAGNRGQISYATTKAGLEGAQGTLSREAMYHGVRCAIIHPGFTDTSMVRVLGEDYVNSRILPQTQLRRLILPEEIADAICFLIRNAAVSGQLWADAGWHPTA
ncbi:MAG: SDR family NAD(P)-dependent oxidoreductase [Phycisphaerales bacterium]|nr:SDR family NAD(P)-dependent oxidoreductase [Phycisphaerales bacterium]